MPITYSGFQTQAAGRGTTVTTLSPEYPPNVAGQIMLAFVNVTDENLVAKPNITPPAGWTLIVDNGSLGLTVRRAAYRKLGDGSTGPMTWTFDTGIRGNVNVLVWNEINTTSPINASSFRNNGSTSSPTATAVTTTSPDCMLVAAWFEGGTCYHFTTNDFSETLVDIIGTTNGAERPTLIVDGIQAVAGSSGTKTATSYCLENVNVSQAQAILVALAPAPNPSVPTLTYPNGGEQLTAGAAVTVTCAASTSPTVAQSSLVYEFSYSANNGGSWTVIGNSSAGVPSRSWTVPSTVGTAYLVRVRSYDGTLYSLAYDTSDAAFSVISETTPGQPVITAPSVGSVHNKASNVTVAWTHQGGVGNPQVAFTLQWANNAAFTSPTTVGPTTTGTQSTSIDFSGQASGTTIYVKVKTQGVSVYSAYSNIVSFVVASLPATPNITAPTAGSPPTTPLPTVTFTSADAFVARKMRVTLSGTEVYNSGEVVSQALSFTSGYSFANGVAVVLYLSVKNQYGLWSAEDSESLTPSYSGPAAPTLTCTVVNDSGYILHQIANSDTPTYNELWTYGKNEDPSVAYKIGAGLPVDATFIDYNSDDDLDGLDAGRYFFARAYNSSLFTDSSHVLISSGEVVLSQLFLHAVSRTNTSSNAVGQAVKLLNVEATYTPQEMATTVNLIGRTAPTPLLGAQTWQRLSVVVILTNAEISTLTDLQNLWKAQEDGETVICARDQFKNRIFGKMSALQVTDNSSHLRVAFEIVQTKYSEGL